MAVPKRRTSKSKKRMRRTHFKAAMPTLAPCPKCGESRVPHRVCPNCGYYRGVRRIAIADE
jgi:large subunit ribosomal protein L32